MKKLQLTKGKFALVSDEDYELVKDFKWSATCNPDGRRPGSEPKWYAVRGDKWGSRIYLHRFLMRTPSCFVVNHKCGNSLDCRRENMHNCTQKTNSRHTHSEHPECDCWEATQVYYPEPCL